MGLADAVSLGDPRNGGRANTILLFLELLAVAGTVLHLVILVLAQSHIPVLGMQKPLAGYEGGQWC